MTLILQRLLLRVYKSWLIQAISATPIGRGTFESAYFFYKDWIEVPGADHLAAYVCKNEWVIDVGANIGFFTQKFASWVSDAGRVLAVEPEHLNYTRLLERMRHAGHAQVLIAREAAADVRDGTVFLAVNRDHPGDHSISDRSGMLVAARRIDSLVAELGSPLIGLIKIDTQGAELRVIAGALETIKRCKPVLVVEIDEGSLQALGTSAAQLIDTIVGLGYTFALLTRHGVEPLSVAELRFRIAKSPERYLDVVCRPDDAPVEPTAGHRLA
jgi:FkbM family methyltransferase